MVSPSPPLPLYLETAQKGILSQRIAYAQKALKACNLCPRKCRVDRSAGQPGICKTGHQAVVASFNAHFGEESPLVGRHGSGTIFFSHCNLLCSFCQNFDISHEGWGEEVTDEQLAGIMLALQDAGCHNINFVTPSHVVPQILSSLAVAIDRGLCLPLVYNTSAYDRVSTLKLLEGIVDIYMPDFKFWDPEVAQRTCMAADYPKVAKRAIMEMHRQVGDLVIDSEGLARRGLLLRHLVLPAGLAGTRKIMGFIARKVSDRTYVNLMAQYRPCGRAAEIAELASPLSRQDYLRAVKEAEAEGITRLDRPRRVFIIE
jgi:putative pyruvate formate lyase activating enzyme